MCGMSFSVQHVLMKPEVKGLENEVAGPPPSEPQYVLLQILIRNMNEMRET